MPTEQPAKPKRPKLNATQPGQHESKIMKLRRVFFREEADGMIVTTWLTDYVECWLELIESAVGVLTLLWFRPGFGSWWVRWADGHWGWSAHPGD